jgi:hypothetical protein
MALGRYGKIDFGRGTVYTQRVFSVETIQNKEFV